MTHSISDVARSTGLTERTLRYYEELGLLRPARDTAGRRTYDDTDVDRLYRIRLLRELGTPVADIDPDASDVIEVTDRHLAAIDAQIATLTRQRERVRAVADRLASGTAASPASLLGVLRGLAEPEDAATRRLTLLVYRDIVAAQQHLVGVFGFAPGELARDGGGTVVHGEVFAGDGIIWMHREAPEFGLGSPATLGGASHCMAIDVDDVEAHHARVRAAGGDITYEPTDMPYGVREYGARDPEGGLWSFMQPLPTPE